MIHSAGTQNAQRIALSGMVVEMIENMCKAHSQGLDWVAVKELSSS